MKQAQNIRLTVPTKFSHPGECEQVDIKHLSKEDLNILRERDPFMYYSIPGVRRAAMHLSSGSSPWPKRSKTSTVARRSRRISFEADSLSLMVEEEFGLASDKDAPSRKSKSKKCRSVGNEYDPFAPYLMAEDFTLSTDEVPSCKNKKFRSKDVADYAYRRWF